MALSDFSENLAWVYAIGVFLAGYLAKKVLDRGLDAWSKSSSFKAIRRRASEIGKGFSNSNFSLGRLETSVYVLDFWPPEYSHNFLLSRKITDQFAPPTEYLDAYNERKIFWENEISEGRCFDGAPKISPKTVKVRRDGPAESKGINIDFAVSLGYAHQRAATDVFRSLDVGVKSKIISDPSTTMEPFFSNSLGVVLPIITGDNYLIFSRRSGQTAVNKGRIVSGVVEGLTMGDVEHGSVNPFRGALRGLKEEFGIELQGIEAEAVRFNGVIFDNDFHEWGLTGYIDLRPYGEKYTSNYFATLNRTGLSYDAWESNELFFIDYDARSIAGFLLSTPDMVNYAIAASVFTLLSTEPQRDVMAAFSGNANLDARLTK